MLTVHLTHETGKEEALDLARRTLLQQNTQLLAKVAANRSSMASKVLGYPGENAKRPDRDYCILCT